MTTDAGLCCVVAARNPKHAALHAYRVLEIGGRIDARATVEVWNEAAGPLSITERFEFGDDGRIANEGRGGTVADAADHWGVLTPGVQTSAAPCVPLRRVRSCMTHAANALRALERALELDAEYGIGLDRPELEHARSALAHEVGTLSKEVQARACPQRARRT